MPRRTETAGRGRTIGSLLTAGAVGVLVLAGASACASTDKTASSSDTSSVPIATTSYAAATASGTAPGTSLGGKTASPTATAPASVPASASASATSSSVDHPIIPGPGGIVVTPQAQLTKVPSGVLTPFSAAEHSADGRTLYLSIESEGGACGQYDVVLQQTSSSVSVGLEHLSSGGRVCPMYVAHMLVEAQLSTPLDGRRVIDLANGQVVSSPEVS